MSKVWILIQCNTTTNNEIILGVFGTFELGSIFLNKFKKSNSATDKWDFYLNEHYIVN